MPKTFYITTAIDYTNSPPHIGHAYEKVLADVIARYHRLKGDKVFFLTGVDQHGQKVQQSAAKAGVAPAEFVKGVTQKFVDLWKKLDVAYTGWAATTDEHHKEKVRKNLQILWDDKDPATGESRWLYKKTQRGFYSVRQEQFLTDKERNEQGEFGPEWQPVEEREEENYYFRLTKHKSLPIDPTTNEPLDPKAWLLRLIESRSHGNHPLVIPDFRATELRNAVEKLEGDLCISRPKSRLAWGIPIPFDEEFVTYVWFDALSNYITFVPDHNPDHRVLGAGQKTEFTKWWRTAVHVIGKDILIPAHGIYWPIMLKAFEYPDEEIPTLLVHGWWNISGAKMSKSLGNIVDPNILADKYGAEAVRYYLMSDIVTGQDADFSEERLVERFNLDLANSMGNLLNRTLSMTEKFHRSRLDRTFEQNPAFKQPDAKWSSPKLASQLRLVSGLPEEIYKAFPVNLEQCEIWAHIGMINHLSKLCNELVQIAAPWELAKDPARKWELSAVLFHLNEALRLIALWVSPVLPKSAHGIFDQLNWKMELSGKEERFSLKDAEWGGLPDGHVVGKPVPLFPRIEGRGD